jgi:hypothetical protein
VKATKGSDPRPLTATGRRYDESSTRNERHISEKPGEEDTQKRAKKAREQADLQDSRSNNVYADNAHRRGEIWPP